MDSFTQPIAVPNTHRLIFTRNVFAPDNTVLADQLTPRGHRDGQLAADGVERVQVTRVVLHVA